MLLRTSKFSSFFLSFLLLLLPPSFLVAFSISTGRFFADGPKSQAGAFTLKQQQQKEKKAFSLAVAFLLSSVPIAAPLSLFPQGKQNRLDSLFLDIELPETNEDGLLRRRRFGGAAYIAIEDLSGDGYKIEGGAIIGERAEEDYKKAIRKHG